MSRRRRSAFVSRFALGAAVCLIVAWPFHRAPGIAARPSSLATASGNGANVVATRLHGSNGFPFVIYHAFCAERDGCAKLTFVGQIEGECYTRRETLERAGLDEWLEWRREFASQTPTCVSCIASKTVSRIKKSFDAATKAVFEERRAEGDYRCVFAERDGTERPESTFSASEIPKKMARFRSTVILSCEVPPKLRRDILLGKLQASLRLNENEYAPLDVVVQRNLTASVAACAWVKGGSYDDRTGKGRALPWTRIAEWIAHHRTIGVDHFAVFDNSEGVYRRAIDGRRDWKSPLSPVLEPLSAMRMATHVPWPSLVRDEVLPGCATADLEERVTRATNGTKTTQSFFGRPSQYAAQNACHLRMVAAGARAVLHVDVDEFVLPREPYAPTASYSEDKLRTPPLVRLAERIDVDVKSEDTAAVALAMPCVFYGPCTPREEVVGSNSSRMLLEDATCAGKVSMYRQKLLASRRADYLWVHYVRSGRGGKVQDLSNDEFVLAHLRPGYSLATAESSRAIDSKTPTATQEEAYSKTVRPRFLSDGWPCPEAAEASAKRLASAEMVENRPTDFSCELTATGRAWGWCWCRDEFPAQHWSRLARNEILALWGNIFPR